MNKTSRLPSSQKISSQLRNLLRSAWHKNSLQYENTMGSNPPILWGTKNGVRVNSQQVLKIRFCIISQISPTRCTILFHIFIYFFSLHVSGTHVPIIRRKSLYLCYTGICHSVWVASGLLVGFSIQPADQMPPIQSDKYQCRIGTAVFSYWRAYGCPKHVEKRNK